MLITGLFGNYFHIFTYGAFFVKQITATNFCKDIDLKYFAGIKFHEFCKLRISQ